MGRGLWVGLALLALALPGRGQPPTIESFVRFHTVCARCHEAQCGGRLSLAAQAEQVASHLRRHAPGISDGEVRELHGLLARTKRECRIPRPAGAAPGQGSWTAERLRPFALPARTHWFVPLGRVEAGSWVLELAGEGTGAVRVELLGTRFERPLDEVVTLGEATGVTLAFELGAASELYLRLGAREPVELRRATLAPAGRD